MRFESKLGNHSLLIHAPPTMGGTDQEPQPSDLFIAALGSCIAADSLTIVPV
jgi:uncharacterized OsmC-like protein